MSKPLISIVIPVYNVAKYLPKCLDSVIDQTLKDIEIILVNDASPYPEDDYTCFEYTKKDSRIKYIIQEKNTRQGGARNTGIKIAQADYIGFVDSDDFISSDMYEKLYNKAIERNYDIVECNFSYIFEDKRKATEKKAILENYDNKILNFFFIGHTPFNKIYKKSLFIENDIFYPEHMFFEDSATIPRLAYKSSKIASIDDSLYYYLIHGASTMNTASSQRFLEKLTFSVRFFSILKDFAIKEGFFDDSIYWLKRLIYERITEINKQFANYKNLNKEVLENYYSFICNSLEIINEEIDCKNKSLEEISRLIKNLSKENNAKRPKDLLFYYDFYWNSTWGKLSRMPRNKKISFILKKIFKIT